MYRKPTSLPEERKYFAFISYSHEDNKWAKWLHQTLEQYRIPKNLVGCQSRIGKIPRRIYPIFRDREELPTSTDLGANIHNALEQSMFLIVICSPHSAISLWVNEEIKQFKSMGGTERIISLIVDGEPNASDKPEIVAKECFPEWLRFRADSNFNLSTERVEPIAADVRANKDGKRNAYLKIVAGLIGVDYAILNDREKKRQHRRFIQIIVTTFMILSAIFSIYKIQHQRFKQEQYKQQQQQYIKSIFEAQKFYNTGYPHLACNALWKSPVNLRNWEWGRLLYLSDPEVSDISQEKDSVKFVIFNPNTTNIAVVTSSGCVIVRDVPTGRKLCELRDTKKRILSAHYTIDGMKIITFFEDNTYRIWDVSTGSLLMDTSDLVHRFGSVVISPNGERLFTYSHGNEPLLWSTKKTNISIPFANQCDNVVFANFSPNGNRILTSSYDGTAKLWNSLDGKLILTLTGNNKPLQYANFSPDGLRVFTKDIDDKGIIWDLETGIELRKIELKRHLITRYVPEMFVFDHKGEKLVNISDDGVVLWNAVAGSAPIQLVGHTWVVYTAVFDPCGSKILTASGDGTARLWDAFTGKQLFVLKGHKGPVYSAKFSSDGTRIITSSRDQTVRIWDANNGMEIAVLSCEDVFTWADFSPNGFFVATISSNGACKLWDATITNNPISFKDELGIWINRGRISSNGSQIIVVTDSAVKIFDIQTGTELSSLPGDRFASFDPAGKRILTGAQNFKAIIWDSNSKEKLAVLTDTSGIDFGVFSPDGARIATQSNSATVSLWDVESGKKIVTLPNQATHLSMEAFSYDGSRIATTFFMNPIRIYDTHSGDLISVLSASDTGSDYPVFNTHGSLITGEHGYNNVGLWNSITGDLMASWVGEFSPLFSPDGTLIASISAEGNVIIRSLATRKQSAILEGHIGTTIQINFSPDSKRIVTTGNDGTAKIWDTASGNELMTLEIHPEKAPNLIVFNSDGTCIVTANLSSELQIWQAAPYYVGMLPGSDSMSWESRYRLWKQQNYQIWIGSLIQEY
jgi:WD40 repeat protein